MRFIEKKKVRVGKVKKTEDGEWMVPVYVDGKFNDDMTYYAGEGAEAKKDAEGTRDQIIKDMKNSKEYEFTEEVENREPNLLVIDEEIEIKQGDSVLILEKGDKIEVLKESFKFDVKFSLWVEGFKRVISKDGDLESFLKQLEKDFSVDEIVEMVKNNGVIKIINGSSPVAEIPIKKLFI